MRALIASTLDQLVAVCLIAPNLENVLKLLVRERMQVWPYYVVLIVAFILFQPLRNRVVGTYWCVEGLSLLSVCGIWWSCLKMSR